MPEHRGSLPPKGKVTASSQGCLRASGKPVCYLQSLLESKLVACEDSLRDPKIAFCSLKLSDPPLQVKQYHWSCQTRKSRHS